MRRQVYRLGVRLLNSQFDGNAVSSCPCTSANILHHKIDSRLFSNISKSEPNIKVLPTDKISQLRSYVDKIVNADKAFKSVALAHEACQCITHLHSLAISNPSKDNLYDLTESLLLKLLEVNKSSSIAIPLETTNKALDCWRLVLNHKAPLKFDRNIAIPGSSLKYRSSLMNRGLELMHKIRVASIEHQLNKKSQIDHPNVKSFNIVMDVFAKYAMLDEAKSLFQEMLSSSKSGRPDCRPDTITRNSLLLAHANAAAVNASAATEAKDILEEMFTMYHETLSPDYKPDVISYSTVLAAYANAAALSSSFAEEAENLLHKLIHISESVDSIEWEKPNEICFNCVIKAWSRSGATDAATRAFQILIDMQKYTGSRNSSLETQTALMGTYSTPEEAEAILNTLVSKATDSGDFSRMPNSMTFTTYLNCLAQYVGKKAEGNHGETISKAEAVLDRMLDLYNNGAIDAKPSIITYNALINVIAKSNVKDSGLKAEKYLEFLENESMGGDLSMKPDKFTFVSVIDAFARQGDGKGAERILLKLIDRSDKNDLESHPFSAAINAYASTGHPQDAERIMALKDDLYLKGWVGLGPDEYTMTGVINAYINSNRSDRINKCLNILEAMRQKSLYSSAAHTSIIQGMSSLGQSWTEPVAIELFREMWSRYDQGHISMKPKTAVYNSLINYFSKSRDKKSRNKALVYLNELEETYLKTNDPDFRPDNVSFNACLSSFTKARDSNEAMQAEEVLKRMERYHDEGFTDICPDAFSMTSVCASWANSGADPERCERILYSMQQMYENGNENMKPTKVAFGAVVNAWSKVGNVDRAEAIVRHMEDLSRAESQGMSPNSIIYNSLINAYATSRRPDSIQKVESILNKMRDEKKNGNIEASPTRISFNSVLTVYQRSSDRFNALVKAEKLLKEIEFDPSIQPDVVTYTTYLNIISRAPDPKKSILAQNVLTKMEKLSQSNPKVSPNNFTYDAILKTCATITSTDPQIVRHALKLAVSTMTKFQSSEKFQPTSYSYNIFFSVLEKLGHGEEKEKLFARSFSDCCKSGLLDEKTFDTLNQKILFNRIMRNMIKGDASISLKFSDVPQTWKSNTNKRNIASRSDQRFTERVTDDSGRRRLR